MKKVFMLLMIAGSMLMFTACGSNTETTEETPVVEEVQAEESQVEEVQAPAIEVENASDTTTVQE